jgi:hypothetical protein
MLLNQSLAKNQRAKLVIEGLWKGMQLSGLPKRQYPIEGIEP